MLARLSGAGAAGRTDSSVIDRRGKLETVLDRPRATLLTWAAVLLALFVLVTVTVQTGWGPVT
jgi:hypothetical protein